MNVIERAALDVYLLEYPQVGREFYELLDRVGFNDDDSIVVKKQFEHMDREDLVGLIEDLACELRADALENAWVMYL
jgi:hypothetical protein